MSGAYPASRIKRKRSTKAEVETRRRELFDIVREMFPMSVRGVYYQATVRSLVEKTEGGYDKVQHDLVLMRRAGDLPYGWITDNTRWQRKPRTSAVSTPRWTTHCDCIGSHSGPTPIATSRSGLRRTRWRESSFP